MGFMANSKAASMAKHAERAFAGDGKYFTPVVNFPTFKMGFSGPVEDWPPVLEAIESAGWVLHTWSVVQDAKGNPQGMPLFIRP